jgi:hypothetical protein
MGTGTTGARPQFRDGAATTTCFTTRFCSALRILAGDLEQGVGRLLAVPRTASLTSPVTPTSFTRRAAAATASGPGRSPRLAASIALSAMAAAA